MGGVFTKPSIHFDNRFVPQLIVSLIIIENVSEIRHVISRLRFTTQDLEIGISDSLTQSARLTTTPACVVN